MSKDGGGYSGDERLALVSLASQVRTLKIQIEGYKQHIQIAEKSYKEHRDLLKAQVQINKDVEIIELKKKLKDAEKAEDMYSKNSDYFERKLKVAESLINEYGLICKATCVTEYSHKQKCDCGADKALEKIKGEK
jgi:hypothetical protein